MAELIAFAALSLLIFFVAHLRSVAFAGGMVGGAMILSAHLQIFSGTQIGVWTRLVGLALLLVVALSKTGRPPAEKRIPGLLSVTFLGGVVYTIVTVVTSDAAALIAGLAFIFAVFVISKIGSSENAEEILAGAFTALGALIFISAALYVGGYGEAVPGGRLRGVFANANTLGFFAALAALLLMFRSPRHFRYVGVIVALASLLWSGSRSALLALACALVAWILMRLYRGSVRGLVLTSTSVVGGVGLLWWQKVFDPSIVFREGNSRDLGTNYALNVADWSLFSGVGYEQSRIEVASTPLRWLAEGGLLCAVLILAAYVLAFISALPVGPTLTAVSLFGIVSSLFEGWYIAGGSALFVYFWLGQAYVSTQRVRSVHRGDANPSTDPGVRPNGRAGPRFLGGIPKSDKFGARVGRSPS